MLCCRRSRVADASSLLAGNAWSHSEKSRLLVTMVLAASYRSEIRSCRSSSMSRCPFFDGDRGRVFDVVPGTGSGVLYGANGNRQWEPTACEGSGCQIAVVR